jgi:Fe2+ or Zn2+ uptake regulation protein
VAKTSVQARNTRQLEVIWDAVKDDKSHPTADQIYDKVRKRLPSISLGTVYRNLQKLVAEKKLQILILGRAQHFDPLVGQHQHFICESCDSVFDVVVDTENELTPAKLPHEGFKVTSHQLAFYGTCKHCAS